MFLVLKKPEGQLSVKLAIVIEPTVLPTCQSLLGANPERPVRRDQQARDCVGREMFVSWRLPGDKPDTVEAEQAEVCAQRRCPLFCMPYACQYILVQTGKYAGRAGLEVRYKDFLTLWKDADPDIPIYSRRRRSSRNFNSRQYRPLYIGQKALCAVPLLRLRFLQIFGHANPSARSAVTTGDQPVRVTC